MSLLREMDSGDKGKIRVINEILWRTNECYAQSSLPAKCLYLICNAATCFGHTFGHLQGATSFIDMLSV